jgi:transposase
MERRKFSREFKLEAVRLVQERGVGFAQAARDLDLHVNVLRKWVREQAADPQQAFPGKGQMKPEQLEIDRLRKEVARLKAERDILKKAAVGSTGQRNGSLQHIGRGLEAKGFPGPGVELKSNGVEVILAVAG